MLRIYERICCAVQDGFIIICECNRVVNYGMLLLR